MLVTKSKSWKDMIDKPAHKTFTRRDFIAKGMATSAISLVVPKLMGHDLIAKAYADTMSCTPAARATGAIAQIFANGGPTMGARFFSKQQATYLSASANMAANYGIMAKNIVQVGNNLYVDANSPFGATLLQGPPGYPGGPTAWQTQVLSKTSGGGHLGPFNQDDGAGQDTGLVGAVSPFKTSIMGKDLRLQTNVTLASWASASPASTVQSITSKSLASTFSLTPSANGLTNTAAMTAASNAAFSISSALSSVFGTSQRKGTQTLLSKATCAFSGNAAYADPNYGLNLFTPANISAFSATPMVTISSLSAQEQALLAGFYQSATGTAGGVLVEFDGGDYHGQTPDTISSYDIQDARAFVMFLSACAVANSKGSMIYTANGQAIANGTNAIQQTVDNGATTLTVQAPAAQGDAGGSYNAGLILFYDPAGSAPSANYVGTISPASGNASSTISSTDAMGGLFLSALQFINNGTIPAAAQTAMSAGGVAATSSGILVF